MIALEQATLLARGLFPFFGGSDPHCGNALTRWGSDPKILIEGKLNIEYYNEEY